ncbi:MAG: DUF58 domain-containing protein [Planctomycetes bacterium]|nr:DUF58 domain-containing protein [Planctomycetota bacterium]
MLTGRGWWFLVAVLVLLIVGLGGLPQGLLPRAFVANTPLLSLLCISLLIWFLGSWVAFAIRVRLALDRLVLERRLFDEHGDLETLWARCPATVSVTLSCSGAPAFIHFSVTDRVPVLVSRREGEHHAEGSLAGDQALRFTYRIECPAPGRLRFDGVRVRAIDLQGFFLVMLFLRRVKVIRVLPALANARGQIPSAKRHNLIPLMGTHPHRRAGSGSDLLDLRDYLPGDPPKMIAWKASARRDRLMTRELESEVPIRCTLFVDTSNSTRVGPVGRNALARFLEIASAVIQANARARDLTGLCFLDETKVTRTLRPGRGTRHVLRMMRALADAGDLFPETQAVPLSRLIASAYGVVQDIYPDYLESDLNGFPIWLPLWSPQPAYTVPDRVITPAKLWLRPFRWLRRRFRESPLAVHRWRYHRFSPRYHRLFRWRKQVAAILSVQNALDPGGLAMLLEDDALCRKYVAKFLAEHQTPCPQPLYDEQGRYLFESPKKLDVLADALSASVRQGQDNELFVLLIDFLEAEPHLDKVLRAIQVARGRHHQVIVVCPWPTGMDADGGSATLVDRLLSRASQSRVAYAFAQMRQAFARLGVTVLAAPEDQAVALILHRMHRLRTFQRGVR